MKKCKQCGKKFKSAWGVTVHANRMHPKLTQEKAESANMVWSYAQPGEKDAKISVLKHTIMLLLEGL